MKSCEYYQELISRSLDDELEIEERKELAVHLAGCPSCKQMRQLMADISQTMENDMEELPDGLHETIMAGIRRSEMIKNNAPAKKPGRHFAPAAGKMSKPLRNLLAAAACMALVIVAALSANPASRAESVVAEREARAITANSDTENASVNTEEPVYSREPSETAAPAAATPTAKPAEGAPNTIITTPAPTPDECLGLPKLPSPQTPVPPVQTPTPVAKASPTPVPVQTAAPVETQAPVQTQLPVSVPTEEPIPSPVIPPVQEPENQTISSGAAIYEESPAAAQAPESTKNSPMSGEVHKAPPARVFSMFPSLASIDPEEQSKGTESDLPDALAGDSQENAITVEEPPTSPEPDKEPAEVNLMECEDAENIMLLLMGMLDEQGQAPEEVELPEAEWDESYVIDLVIEEIPCELTVQIIDGKVYFSLAEIIIEPVSGATVPGADSAADGNGLNPPADKSNAAPAGEQPPVRDEDFEPIWFLAQCSADTFTELLNQTMK